jgi:hypothetical protein
VKHLHHREGRGRILIHAYIQEQGRPHQKKQRRQRQPDEIDIIIARLQEEIETRSIDRSARRAASILLARELPLFITRRRKAMNNPWNTPRDRKRKEY